MNKAGVIPFYWVGLILAVAVILVLSVFYTKLFTIQQDVQDETACSVAIAEAHAAKKISGGKTLGLPGISKCERENLLIKKKDIVESRGFSFKDIFTGAAAKDQSKIAERLQTREYVDQDKASRIIADSMKRCWKMYGAGKMDPFSNWGDEGISYCAVCKVVEFDEKLEEFFKNNPDQYIQSPLIYMASHRISENGPTYLEYLYGNDGKTLQITSDKLEQLQKAIIPEGSYVMIQMYKEKTKSKTTVVLEIAIPVTVGLAVTFLTFNPVAGAAAGSATAAGIAGGVVATKVAFVAAITAGVAAGAATSFAGNELGVIGYPGKEAFRDCKECNAFGGMQLIPNEDTFSLTWEAKYKLKEKEQTNTETLKMCDILVN